MCECDWVLTTGWSPRQRWVTHVGVRPSNHYNMYSGCINYPDFIQELFELLISIFRYPIRVTMIERTKKKWYSTLTCEIIALTFWYRCFVYWRVLCCLSRKYSVCSPPWHVIWPCFCLGGDDRRVLVWKIEQTIRDIGEPTAMTAQHTSNIFCLGYDSAGTKLFSAGNDDQVIVHNLKT